MPCQRASSRQRAASWTAWAWIRASGVMCLPRSISSISDPRLAFPPLPTPFDRFFGSRTGPGAPGPVLRELAADDGVVDACAVAIERCVGAFLEQLVEEGPVMHHRLPQIFGRAVAGGRGPGEPVAFAVVLDDVGVVDGDVGGPLFEVVHRVAAIRHHLLDQHVRLAESAVRIVHEARLDALPLAEIALACAGREGPDVELIAPLGAGLQI